MTELTTAKKGSSKGIFKTETECPTCNDKSHMSRKVGNNGVFLGCENWPKCGHIMNINEDGTLEDAQVETGTPCPDCGGKVTERDGKWGKWLGCSSYPVCKWTGKFDSSGNIVKKKKAEVTTYKCPNCKDGMLAKRSRKDGTGDFLGCNKYPKCKTAMSIGDKGEPVASKLKAKKKSTAKPTGKKCPKCKKGELLERNGKFGKFEGCSRFRDGCKYIGKL
jgi:DNA topoisomerase-1